MGKFIFDLVADHGTEADPTSLKIPIFCNILFNLDYVGTKHTDLLQYSMTRIQISQFIEIGENQLLHISFEVSHVKTSSASKTGKSPCKCTQSTFKYTYFVCPYYLRKIIIDILRTRDKGLSFLCLNLLFAYVNGENKVFL